MKEFARGNELNYEGKDKYDRLAKFLADKLKPLVGNTSSFIKALLTLLRK